MSHGTAIQFVGYAWLVWVLSWIAGSFWQDRAVKRPATSSEILYRVLSTVGAGLLLGVGARFIGGERQLWQLAPSTNAVALALAAFGLVFTWWARWHLGRLWSSSVTRKADHRVVDTGPYRLVRHPIYSGVSLAAIATALLRGTLQAGMGVSVLILGFYVKARLEEQFLREQLGPGYDDYARRVAMLVPFLK